MEHFPETRDLILLGYQILKILALICTGYAKPKSSIAELLCLL